MLSKNICSCGIPIFDFLSQAVHTSVGQWEQAAGHSQGRQTGQYSLAENRKTGKQLEQQQQEYCHNHWLHSPGLTGCSHEWWTGQQDSQLRKIQLAKNDLPA